MDDEIFSIPLDTTDPEDIAALDRALEEKYKRLKREKAESAPKDEQNSA